MLRIGLPYPFFIKMDDVEYSLRLQEHGVELVIPFSFWVLHDDFEEKYSAAMQYFRFRNRWVLLAQQGRITDPTAFFWELDRIVRDFVSARKYEHAQLALDATEDFLTGPETLITRQHETLSRVFRTVRQEKNAPLLTLPAGAVVANDLPPTGSARTARLTARTWNNHFLPLKEHVVIDTTRPYEPTACRRGRAVTYWNPQQNVGYTVARDSAPGFGVDAASTPATQCPPTPATAGDHGISDGQTASDIPRLLGRPWSTQQHSTSVRNRRDQGVE